MIVPLYPRFIATSVGAGVPRGSPCPPAAPGRYSPIPRRRATDTDRPRPPRTFHPARSKARTGTRGCNTRHQPRKYPRKSPARPSSTSIVTRLSQDSPPETGHAPTFRAQICPCSAVRHERFALPIPPTGDPARTYTRATRRHSRNPAPAPGLDSRPFAPFAYICPPLTSG